MTIVPGCDDCVGEMQCMHVCVCACVCMCRCDGCVLMGCSVKA